MAKTAEKKETRKPVGLRTTEEAIKNIRGLRAANLFCCDMTDIDQLLAEHDRLVIAGLQATREEVVNLETIQNLQEQVTSLTARAEKAEAELAAERSIEQKIVHSEPEPSPA